MSVAEKQSCGVVLVTKSAAASGHRGISFREVKTNLSGPLWKGLCTGVCVLWLAVSPGGAEVCGEGNGVKKTVVPELEHKGRELKLDFWLFRLCSEAVLGEPHLWSAVVSLH